MRIFTKCVSDIRSGAILEAEFYDYDGPVEECKRGESKGFSRGQTDLMTQLAQGNLAQQKGLVGMVTPYLQQILSSGQGFPPEMLAGMRTQALQGTGQAYQNAIGAVKQQLANRGLGGGATPVGGLYGQGFGQLLGQQAQTQSGLLSNIDIQNAQQRLSNIFNSAGALGGLAGIFNPSPFTQGASSALGTYGEQFTAPTAWTQFAGGLGQGIGGALGGKGASYIPGPK